MSRCALGFDADDVAGALRGGAAREGRVVTPEHLDECASCRGERALLEEVYASWRDARAEDDRSRAVFREQRLVHRVRRRSARATWWGYATLASLVVAIVVGRPWRVVWPTQAEGRGPAAATQGTQTQGSAPVPRTSTPSQPLAPEGSVVVVARVGAITPEANVGDRLSGKVHVGTRASLTLAWSFALDDAVEITGPADLELVGAAPGTLVMSEGRAVVRATGELALRTTEASMRGKGASWQVDAASGRTRVRSLRGEVSVRGADEARDPWILREGGELTLPELAAATERRKPSTADEPDPVREFARGVASLAAGDRVAAERSFRVVADSHRASASLRSRAAFRWAELALARGERDRARAELTRLLKDPDPGLAADAAFLLGRSASPPAVPEERARERP